MKAFTDLNLGFTNAENYRKRANKDLLTRYFVRDDYLERLLDPNIYFLVGEKGTGKTAYSTYLRNTQYKGKYSFTYDVRQTEYQKFLELKKLGHLPLSQYSEVWRTLLLILAATSVLERSSTPGFLMRFTKLRALKGAIDDFYENAFSPEIVKILTFVELSERSASLIAKHNGLQAGASAKDKVEVKDSNATFQTNLLKIRKAFEGAIESLKLDNDYLIFIDGIDVRPAEISYEDYFECVRGLIEAVWTLNNDFLADIKDSVGRIKIVLLVRPDIFLRAGLHNVNTKIRDNSVLLNWGTTYKDYRTSRLFKVADRLLAAQQDKMLATGATWDHYFPFEAVNIKASRTDPEGTINSFLSFVRFSYYRPRDISAMMATMKDILSRRGTVDIVGENDFNDSSFRDAHSDYLLGELRDQLLFYYSQDEFELFLQFFAFLKGKKKFLYSEFSSAFNGFIAQCKGTGQKLPVFFESGDVFLQFLYEQTVICYKETEEQVDGVTRSTASETFFRWCFRERTPSNLAPKVRANVEYEIFYGLTKALNVGRAIRTNEKIESREIGTVISLNEKSRFGFIRGGALQTEYYFKFDQIKGDYKPRIGDRVSYEAQVKYGKLRALGIIHT